jgi:cell division protein FtsN
MPGGAPPAAVVAAPTAKAALPPAAKPVLPPAAKPVLPPAAKPVLPPAAKPVLPPVAAPAIAKPAAPTANPIAPAAKPDPTAQKPEAAPAKKPGTAQLGAFSTPEKANEAWARLAPKHGLSGKRVIAVEANGHTLYRLRASGDSAQICAKLKAAGDACAVVE